MKVIKKECIDIETTDSHNGSGTQKQSQKLNIFTVKSAHAVMAQ